MTNADPYQEALLQNQALSEAIEVMSAIEDGLAASLSVSGADAYSEIDSLGTRLRSLQERFAPRLNSVGLFAAQLNSILVRMEEGKPATPKDVEAAQHALADLESYFRQSSAALEQLDRWVRADHAEVAAEIARLADSLHALKTMLSHSNAPVRDADASDVFRNTVVQLLSAALEELKAPAVNTRRLGGLADMLKGVLRKSAEKQMGEAADAVIQEAVDQSQTLVEKAQNLPGLTDLLG